MTLPIERVDVDQLIMEAGDLRARARNAKDAADNGPANIAHCFKAITEILNQHANDMLRHAAYIRFLEARLYPPEKIAPVPAAGPYSSKPPRPRPGPGADHSD